MSAEKLTFKTTLLLAKKTATGVQVPDEIVEKLGVGKKPPVKVMINDYTYPSTIAVMDGVFMLPVSADVREKAKVQAGETIEVTLQLDTEPREVALPADFEQLLEANQAAKAFFQTLSNSNKKRFVIPIEQAKTDETRNKRIKKAIADLEQQKKV
ncbi:YdeI/OmpD-associated family protein [Dyadobacter sp. CY343]|uniref:YdeI/OmpD-associated family protein n=1 Tax=Dyadobacter sp. CY343 TaxID=2907299 RepID=UPI001F1A6A3E|nr:YdeI/OmpD-associated family protein [Dyadobacter sp. CY343]MCE7059490.1 YdeI/OmpD-associated family protein [Dyadobacter sp. CY343]